MGLKQNVQGLTITVGDTTPQSAITIAQCHNLKIIRIFYLTFYNFFISNPILKLKLIGSTQ